MHTTIRILVAALVLSSACASREEQPRDTTVVPATSPAATPAAAAGEGADGSGAASRWVMTPRGFGAVLAGMSTAELSRTLGEPVQPSYDVGSRCAYVRPGALPRDVLVMIENDTVARVDVRAKGIATAEGAGVGDAEASVLQRYEGRVRTAPHKYTGPTGHYLIVSAPPDTAHLLVFETDGRTVQSYRGGRRPAAELVEGCS